MGGGCSAREEHIRHLAPAPGPTPLQGCRVPSSWKPSWIGASSGSLRVTGSSVFFARFWCWPAHHQVWARRAAPCSQWAPPGALFVQRSPAVEGPTPSGRQAGAVRRNQCRVGRGRGITAETGSSAKPRAPGSKPCTRDRGHPVHCQGLEGAEDVPAGGHSSCGGPPGLEDQPGGQCGQNVRAVGRSRSH